MEEKQQTIEQEKRLPAGRKRRGRARKKLAPEGAPEFLMCSCPCARAENCPHREDGKKCFFERLLAPIDLDSPRGIMDFLLRKAQFDWLSYVRVRREEALGVAHKESASFGGNLLKTVAMRTMLGKEFGFMEDARKNTGDIPLEQNTFNAFSEWWNDEIEG